MSLFKRNTSQRLINMLPPKFSHLQWEKIIGDFRMKNQKKCLQLWRRAKIAIRDKKIFVAYGSHNTIREILKSRGWVEKLNDTELKNIQNNLVSNEIVNNLERVILSNMVKFYSPNLIWLMESGVNWNLINMRELCINKITMYESSFTTKSGFCNTIKDKQWHCIENVSAVNAPRMYNSFETNDFDDFKKDYKMTACINLLKWIANYYNEQIEIDLSGDGDVSISILDFAIDQCNHYIILKTHCDSESKDKAFNEETWINFFEVSYDLIKGNKSLDGDMNDIQTRAQIAKTIINSIEKYNPLQVSEGLNNVWIVKPANSCRGKGISIETNLSQIVDKIMKARNMKYVIQKYIEKPLLIYETKFDIRQYYAITRVYPLTIWMYRDCYLRFTSQKYNLNDFHESIHLTNNAVQCKYPIFKDRHCQLTEYKMWDLDTFKKYLNDLGNEDLWDNIIYTGMKKNIIGISLCGQPNMLETKSCFELYGCDFILDKKFKPWLIEINSRPDLSASTPVTKKICKNVLEDLMKVLIDHKKDPNASTGCFERIFQQRITRPKIDIHPKTLKIQGRKIRRKYLKKI